MAKITIKELFYGDKYNIMGEVVKQVFARQDEFIANPHTFRELEIVRQALIAVEKMKKNGHYEMAVLLVVKLSALLDDNIKKPRKASQSSRRERRELFKSFF